MGRMRFAITAVAVVFLGYQGIAPAGTKGHEGMQGTKAEVSMEGRGDMKKGDHGKKGDGIFTGKVGPWNGEARLIDMRASIEKAKASGRKMEGTMKSHHFELFLADPKTRKAVNEGKSSLTVIGPDKKEEKSVIAALVGHFGVDVDLARPGIYTFKVAVESGGKKGSATFSHTVK